jgi:8-oxo-dGTP pyrophosphatase MutT (NUDIX family)
LEIYLKLTELAKEPKKAGLIPYVIENGQPLFMFMKSSDASFGGDAPMISKGHIDDGESPKEAALREAEEELGLKRSNIVASTLKEVWRGKLSGQTETYVMVIYACQVKNKNNFGKPHYETESVHWMTNEIFQKSGRSSQRKIVQRAHNLIV